MAQAGILARLQPDPEFTAEACLGALAALLRVLATDVGVLGLHAQSLNAACRAGLAGLSRIEGFSGSDRGR